MSQDEQYITIEETPDLVVGEATMPEWGYVEMRDVWEMRGNATVAQAMANGLAQPRWGTSIAIPREYADIINQELQQLQLQQLVYDLRKVVKEGTDEELEAAWSRVYQLVDYSGPGVLRALHDEGLIK